VRRNARRAPLTPTEQTKVKEAVSDLHDQTLATMLKRFLTKAAAAERQAGVEP
jgi:hypothetical protein